MHKKIIKDTRFLCITCNHSKFYLEVCGLIADFLTAIDEILWGPPLLIGLLGTGLYLTLASKFWQVRHFKDALSSCFFKKADGEPLAGNKPKVSAYMAACTAIAGSVGAGNIGGVASAIALGGPGALFWMWMTAVVGMMTKMTEVTLATYYRKTEPTGEHVGGPLFYMQKGLGPKFKYWWILAIIFGCGLSMQLVLAPEAFTVGESLQELTGIRAVYCSVFFCIMCWAVILGGLKRVLNFASFMMPFMAMLYIIFGLYVIIVNITAVPAAIALIVKSAFTPVAAAGGFAGTTVLLCARTGIARGLFSNEAGWGTSPMVHATADQNHPVEQGMWGVMEVFIDTLVICSITGLVIVLTGEWSSGKAGATLTTRAFAHGLGRFAPYCISICLFLFCWTTVTGWFSYFKGIVEFAFKGNPKLRNFFVRFLELTTPLYGLIIAILIDIWKVDLAYAWLIVDISSALPTFINLIVLILLSKKFFAIVRDYEGPRKLWGLDEYDKVDVD